MVMSQGHEILPGIVALFLAAAAAAAGRPRESVVERGDRIHNSGHGDHNVERDMQNISALLHWVNLMKPHSFLSLLMPSEHGGGGGERETRFHLIVKIFYWIKSQADK